MGESRKRQSAGLALVMLALLPAAAGAEDMAPMAPAPQVTALAPPKPESDAEKLDALMAELAQPGRDDWQEIENKVERIWSKSGSAAMDLLLRRGNDAMAAEDYPGALEHLSALIEQAPDFAEGWNARATTYYLMGEYSLSIADVEHVLALNPRHFGALAGLAAMLEDMGEPDLALKALLQVQKLNPNRPNINEAVTRLQRQTGMADL